ncbi:hypothetical protein DM02DRAFT_733063 [Periconia macrospinosa]|uniref:Uncharacterized protein n=1 Tax=Periconia macrospinosa TaxID=97972 RepID=A0A2V1D8Q6_9PLEO|nr:hypothetical protein DM02DRAFT_733063 [Periconia macrospinosa]
MAQYASLGQQEFPSTMSDDSKPTFLVDRSGANTPTQGKTISSHLSSSEQDRTTNLHYDAKEWISDVFAWFVGTILLAVIITIMVVYHNKNLSQWHSNVQITTIVALLSQVAQSAFLIPIETCISQLKWSWFRDRRSTMHLDDFDQASRGFKGSTKMLFTLSKVPRLVHLGALSMILMITFQPFFQQAINISLETVEVKDSPAAVPRAVSYQSPASSNVWNEDYLYRGSGNGADLYLSSIMLSSMTSTTGIQTPSNVPANCPTGQCSWSDYTTLALCTSLSNITTDLIYQSTDIGDLITLPGITNMDKRIFRTMSLTTVFGNGRETLGFSGQRANLSTLALNKTGNVIQDLAQVYLSYYDPCLADRNLTAYRRTENWRAYKASVGLCLQTLSTNYNSSTNTSIISSHRDVVWENKKDEFNISYWHTNHPSAPGDDFSIRESTADYIGGQLGMLFNISASAAPGGVNYLFGSVAGTAVTNDLYGTNPLVCSNNTENGLKGFTKRLDNLVNSINNGFRAASSSVTVKGKSFENLQQIQVNFWFLVPPCALYVLLTGFLIATILHTTNVPLWKSSQLALLYAMSNPEMLSTKVEMEERARKTKLRFSKGDWQLKHE